MTKPIILIIGLCVLASNALPAVGTNTKGTSNGSDIELPLPVIPSSLRTPKERAAYVMNHFWDSLQPTDTARTRNRQFMEQNFVNFVNLYQHADSSQWQEPTDRFLSKVTGDSESRQLAYELIGMYLSDAESPVKSDDAYILFLKRWISLPGLDTYELEGPKYRLATALKNRPGSPATDFDFITSAGNATSLLSQSAKTTLMLLYDPDCDHCMSVIESLRNDTKVNSLISSGKLHVMAIYVEGDRQLWEKTKDTMPGNWTVGADDSGIIENDLYELVEMPGIYLLDGQKRVILRNPSIDSLSKTLDSI